MGKLIKSDIVIAVIVIASWLFYLVFDGSTRFDVNEIFTLPLLVAAELSTFAVLYAAGRYFTAKKGRLITGDIANLIDEHQAGQTPDNAGTKKNKS